MTYETIMAGFGGQGLLFSGKVLAYAGLIENRELSWLPSYGPEMRGGTCNCTVIVSDGEISCPLIYEADAVVVMNLPSLIKFEPLVKKGGKLFYNSTLIEQAPKRDDIEIHAVPANEKALELGNIRAANMVMIGELIRSTGVVEMAMAEKVLEKTFTGRKAALLPLNKKALGL